MYDFSTLTSSGQRVTSLQGYAVIVDRHVDDASRVDQLPGHRPIVGRRRGITGWMIMRDDDPRRGLRDRAAKHLARVHQRAVEDPARDEEVAHHRALAVQ